MPDSDEAYLCSAFRVKDWMGIEPLFIQGFLVNASNRMLHHMIIQACGPLDQQPGEVWNCMPDMACPGASKILYAWEMNDPPSKIPTDVGFKVGDEFPNIVLQVHYADEMERDEMDQARVQITYTEKRPTYYGGFYILLGTDIYLPPHLPVIHDDVNCQLNNLQAPMTLFAFRAHTHKHG